MHRLIGVNNVKKVITVIIVVIFATLLLPLAIVYLMGAGNEAIPSPSESEAVSVIQDNAAEQQE